MVVGAGRGSVVDGAGTAVGAGDVEDMEVIDDEQPLSTNAMPTTNQTERSRGILD